MLPTRARSVRSLTSDCKPFLCPQVGTPCPVATGEQRRLYFRRVTGLFFHKLEGTVQRAAQWDELKKERALGWLSHAKPPSHSVTWDQARLCTYPRVLLKQSVRDCPRPSSNIDRVGCLQINQTTTEGAYHVYHDMLSLKIT